MCDTQHNRVLEVINVIVKQINVSVKHKLEAEGRIGSRRFYVEKECHNRRKSAIVKLVQVGNQTSSSLHLK